MSWGWISTPWLLAAASRSLWSNVSPLSSHCLPRCRAMSISTPRPTTPFSAMGSTEAFSIAPTVVRAS